MRHDHLLERARRALEQAATTDAQTPGKRTRTEDAHTIANALATKSAQLPALVESATSLARRLEQTHPELAAQAHALASQLRTAFGL